MDINKRFHSLTLGTVFNAVLNQVNHFLSTEWVKDTNSALHLYRFRDNIASCTAPYHPYSHCDRTLGQINLTTDHGLQSDDHLPCSGNWISTQPWVATVCSPTFQGNIKPVR